MILCQDLARRRSRASRYKDSNTLNTHSVDSIHSINLSLRKLSVTCSAQSRSYSSSSPQAHLSLLQPEAIPHLHPFPPTMSSQPLLQATSGSPNPRSCHQSSSLNPIAPQCLPSLADQAPIPQANALRSPPASNPKSSSPTNAHSSPGSTSQ